MAGFDNDILYGSNVDFTGTFPVSGQINLDGELLVGATTAPFIRSYVPTGSNGVVVNTGPGTLDFSLSSIPNSALTNSSITINTGSGLTGGGVVTLGGSINISATAGGGSVTEVFGTANQVAVATGTTTPVISLIGPYTPATYNAHGVLVGEGTSSIVALATGSAGQVLQSGGAAADPTWTTATFPSTAGGTGTIIRADGTNWVATTATYPATATVSQILYASASNVIGGLATANNGTLVTSATGVPSILTGPGTTGNIFQSNAAAAPSFSTATYPSAATGTGKILIADGTNWVASTPTYPNAASTALKHIKSDGTNFVTTTVTYPDASVTAGKVIVSDGTNYVASTPTFPNASATSGKIIKSDGTNWVASTETYAAPGTSGNVMTSDGTNWTSGGSGGTGIVYFLQSTPGNPVDSATYFFNTGGTFIASTSEIASGRFMITKSGTINICYGIINVAGTLGSAENCTLNIRKNNTTDTAVTSTLKLTAVNNTFNNTSLGISVAAGDYIGFKFTCPAWATNPTTCRITVSCLVE